MANHRLWWQQRTHFTLICIAFAYLSQPVPVLKHKPYRPRHTLSWLARETSQLTSYLLLGSDQLDDGTFNTWTMRSTARVWRAPLQVYLLICSLFFIFITIQLYIYRPPVTWHGICWRMSGSVLLSWCRFAVISVVILD